MTDQRSIVFLKGKRVVLRPLVKEDVSLLLLWINDPDVTQFLSIYLPMMEANENEWFNNLHKEIQNLVLMIVVDEKPIGTMGIHNIDWKNRTANTGALIGEKDYWGKGYGTEAKMLMLNYAFNVLNLRKICSTVLAFNKRSHSYLLKCGYVEEGSRSKQYYINGQYWDEILMAVFKEDFLPLWRKYKKS